MHNINIKNSLGYDSVTQPWESYNNRLFNLFKIKYCIIYLISGSIVLGFFFETSITIVPCFLGFYTLEIFWIYSIGHGVYNQKKIFGMLLLPGIFITGMITASVGVLILAPECIQGYPHCIQGVNMYLVSLLTGTFIGILRWYARMYHVTWYGNESSLRAKFKLKGLSNDAINIKIRYLKTEGWLLDKENSY